MPLQLMLDGQGGGGAEGEEREGADAPGSAGEAAGGEAGPRHEGAPEGAGGQEAPAGESGGKSYTQEDLDVIVARKLAPYAGIDVQEYRALKEARAKQEREALEKRGDFDKILAQTMKEKDEVIEQKDQEIEDLGRQLTRIRVDNTLLEAASAQNAINPRQIVQLLKGNVHYDRKTDTVEVRENGAPLYRSGKPVAVAQYVGEFLSANAHFMPAGPSGSGASGGAGGAAPGSVYKLSAQDAKDPAKYRTAREQAEKAGQTVVIDR